MKSWVYKCNKQTKHEGDWHLFFKHAYEMWGSSEDVFDLSKLKRNDRVIAYQTDTKEIVGLAKVRQSCNRDGYLYLKDRELINAKFIALKAADPEIAKIAAFHRGVPKTIYDISEAEAERLLAAAKAFGDDPLEHEALLCDPDIDAPPKRIETMVRRIIRDTPATRLLKKQYDYRCQICNCRIEFGGDRYYVEVHHIQPLGGGHNGCDAQSNMLVLCPNHHAMFDLHIPEFVSAKRVRIRGTNYDLTLRHPHSISPTAMAYYKSMPMDCMK